MILIFSVILLPANVFAADETDNSGIISGKTYVITSKNSGKVMEVANFGTQNGDKIQQWDYGNGASQQWIIEQVEGKYYKIISKNSSKVIDVKEMSTENGATIHQWDYVNGDNQLWYFEKTDDGYFKIKSKQSNKCIDIAAISFDNGAPMQLWEDVNGDNQKWKIQNVDTVKEDSEYVITSVNSNKVLDVENNSDENGALIQQYEYNGNNNQIWYIRYIDDKYFYIESKNSGKVIDVKNQDTQNGTIVYQWEYNGQDNQLWYFEMDNNGCYKIKSKQSNKCLDIAGISLDNGAKLQIWQDENGDNQKWKVKKINGKNLGDPLGWEIKSSEDTDGDGIVNSLEDEYGTNKCKIDTDNDGVTDYEEIYVYGTNPLLIDTDGDTLDDYSEIMLKLDPLVINTVKEQYSYTSNNDSLGVNMNVTGSASAVTTARVRESDDEFLSGIPNTIGKVLEFSSDSQISSAAIQIAYSEDELAQKEIDEDNLSVYYINEESLTLEKVATTIDKQNKKLNCNLEHFSKYVIGDSSSIVTDLNAIDIIFAIDKSGSMNYNDSNSKRIDVCQQLVKTLSKDTYRFGIVSFDSTATANKFIGNNGIDTITYLSNDRSIVKSSLEKLRGVTGGGTNFADAINKATGMFDDNRRKIVVLLTDGEQTNGNIITAVGYAKENNVQIYTVGLGNDVNVSVLRDSIAKPTFGQYFHADDSDSLCDAFSKLSNKINSSTEKIYVETKNGKLDLVEVKLIEDSGFDVSKNGYPFQNFAYDNDGGNCFGISVTSILYYLNQLPFNSATSVTSRDYNYNVSNNNVFNNNKELMNLKADFNNIRFNDIDTSVNGNFVNFTNEQKEIINMIHWWNDAQSGNWFKTLCSWNNDLFSISSIEDALKERPIQLFYFGFENFKECSHAMVATKLYKSCKDTALYYLEVYDPNYSNQIKYIEIKEKLVGTVNPTLTLIFDDKDVNFDWIFKSTNPMVLKNTLF